MAVGSLQGYVNESYSARVYGLKFAKCRTFRFDIHFPKTSDCRAERLLKRCMKRVLVWSRRPLFWFICPANCLLIFLHRLCLAPVNGYSNEHTIATEWSACCGRLIESKNTLFILRWKHAVNNMLFILFLPENNFRITRMFLGRWTIWFSVFAMKPQAQPCRRIQLKRND